MNLVRTIKRATFACVTMAILVVALHPTGAFAYTKSQAIAKAQKEQAFDCAWGNPLYRCVTPWLFIGCHATGVNKVGNPQYVCGGEFERVRRIHAKYQYCDTTYFLSPFGQVMNYRTYICHDGIPPHPTQTIRLPATIRRHCGRNHSLGHTQPDRGVPATCHRTRPTPGNRHAGQRVAS